MNNIYFLNQRINTKKKLSISLSSVKGLGIKRALYICKRLGFQSKATFSDLDIASVDLLKSYIEDNFIINENMDKKVSTNIIKMIDTGTYKGKRHKLSYPVNGQRTLSNGKTQRRLSRRRFSKIIENYDSKTLVSDKFLHSQLRYKKNSTGNFQKKKKKRGYSVNNKL
jgi:small subunit ribosomal protein S13